MHLSRDLLLLDILIFVKIIKEKILCVAFWNASAEGTCCIEPDLHSVNFGVVVLTLKCPHAKKQAVGLI